MRRLAVDVLLQTPAVVLPSPGMGDSRAYFQSAPNVDSIVIGLR